MISGTVPTNLKSGFRTCGLFPFNKQEVLKKLPEVYSTEQTVGVLNDSLIQSLKNNRGSSAEEKRKRGKKLPKVTKGLEPKVPGEVFEKHSCPCF